MISSNVAHLDLTINNPFILSDLVKRLMENTKDCKDISISPSSGLNTKLLCIRINSQRPTQMLAACGIKLCEIYGAILILVEDGLSGKYHIYPVDSYHIPGSITLANLSFVEKLKVYVQVLKQYRVKVKFSVVDVGDRNFLKGTGNRYGSSILQTEEWKLSNQAFHYVNVNDFEFGQLYQNKVELLQPKASETQAISIVGEAKEEQPFWNEKTRPDPLLEGNRTFDTRGTPFKTHDPRQSRTYVGGFETKADPIRGDDFSNRSFDGVLGGGEDTFGNNDPFGHDQQYRKVDINPSPEHIHHGESASFNLETNANVQANAQSGEAVQVELETDAAHDETYALSADDISEAKFDVGNGCLRVVFNGQPLFLVGRRSPTLTPNIIEFELRTELDKAFSKYLATGGEVNFVKKLARSHRCIVASLTRASVQDNVILINVDATSRERYEQIATLFNLIREKSLLPRDAQGNVLDVHLEESKILPKESLFIRLKDDGVVVDINGVEHQARVKPWNDSALLIATDVEINPSIAELKILAATFKANYGGKAKGEVQIHMGNNEAGDHGFVLEFGQKPRFKQVRDRLEKFLVK